MDIARVPFHFIAGNALEVCTGSSEAEAWFKANLLQDLCSDGAPGSTSDATFTAHQESPTGILLGIDGPDAAAALACQPGPQLTELLLYASTSPPSPSNTAGGIATPPRSSSPDPGDPSAETQPPLSPNALQQPLQVKIYAVPLSSHLSHHRPPNQSPPSPPFSSPSTSQTIEGHFLSPPSPSNPRKRAKLETLFSGAATQSKRARRHGASKSQPTCARTTQAQAQTTERNLPKAPALRSQSPNSLPDSRSSSSSSGNPSVSHAHVGTPSTTNTTATGNPNKPQPPSTLHHFASVENQNQNQSPAPTITPPSSDLSSAPAPPDAHAQNKTLLSRLVLAGMRMYGLLPPTRSVGKVGSGASSGALA